MKLQQLMMAMGLIGGGGKETAADRRKQKNRLAKHNTPPRSMTEQEKEYYARNKTLGGLYR